MRYVYVNAVLAALIVISLIPAPAARPSTRQFAFVGAIAAFALFAQMQGYRTEAANYRETSALTSADVFAIRTAASVVKPDFMPPQGDPQPNAASYLNASRFWGGPKGLSEEQVRAGDGKLRDHVDTTLAQAFGLAVSPLPSLRGVRLAALGRPVLAGAGAAMPAGPHCWALTPASPGADVAAYVKVPPRALGGIVVLAHAAAAQVLSGRYYDQPLDVLGSVAPHGFAAVAIAPDGRRTPWTLQIRSTGALRACGLAR